MIQLSITRDTPTLFFDGGARGNPGEAAGAAVLIMPDGQKHLVSKYLKFATNNEAEYCGLILGLKKAQSLGIQNLDIKGDSNLIINQVNKKWKVKSPNLQNLYQEACDLLKEFNRVSLNWIPREKNKLADQAVNQCIDHRNDFFSDQ
jgi:ribonuclease HI